jgi:hypothetical protein
MAQSTNDRVVALLQEAAETHHRVYRITDGADEDWASWYADWLLALSELPQLLGTRPVRSHLVQRWFSSTAITPRRTRTSRGPRSTPHGSVRRSAERRPYQPETRLCIAVRARLMAAESSWRTLTMLAPARMTPSSNAS